MLTMYGFLINGSIFLITIIGLIYAYYVRAYKYWSSRGVPTVPPKSLFGNIGNPRTRKDAFYISMAKCYQELKDAGHKHGGFYAGSRAFYMPLVPEQVKNILTKDFAHFTNRGLFFNAEKDPLTANLFFINGDDWRNLRVKLTPTFTSGKMKMMYDTLLDCADPLKGKLDKSVLEQEALNVKTLCGCFTMDVIGSCAFGLECNSFDGTNANFRHFGQKTFASDKFRTFGRIIGFMFPKLATKLGVLFIPKDVTDFFTDVVAATIKFRECNSETRNDFMQLLLELKQAGDLKTEQLAAQAFLFFIAGYETSSSTMTYLLYELAKNPDIQDKVRDEIETVLKEHGKLTYEAMKDLKYMKQAIDETLRKYPVVPFLARECVKDYKVPNSDIIIEKDVKVCFPICGYHMDPDNFPNPEVFDPERFSDANKDNIKPYTYMPFGEGPRICIGLRFGVMQVKVGLVSILRNHRLSLNKSTPEKLTWNSQSFILQNNEPILLDVAAIN